MWVGVLKLSYMHIAFKHNSNAPFSIDNSTMILRNKAYRLSFLSLMATLICILFCLSCKNNQPSKQKHQYTLRISLFSNRLGSSESNPIIIEEYSDSAAYMSANLYYKRYGESLRKTNIESVEGGYDHSLYPDGFELLDENGLLVYFPELELLEFKNRREGNLMEQNIAYEGACFGQTKAEVQLLTHFRSFKTLNSSNTLFNDSEFIRSTEHQSGHYKVELYFDEQSRLDRVVFKGDEDKFNFKPQPLKGSLKHVESQIHNFRDAIQKKYGPPQYKHPITHQSGATDNDMWAYIWNIGFKRIAVGAYIQSDMYHFYAEITKE